MALIKCSECGSDVSDKASACPKCGNPISATPAVSGTPSGPLLKKAGMGTGSKIGLTLVALVCAFLGFGFVVGSSPEAKERARDRTAIDLCRKDQADELQSLAVRRLTRQMCDSMEQKFIERWGRTP